MRRKYYILDVFTETALTGNPLAVVVDCDELEDAAMQAIAREFNLSETVFVQRPDSAGTDFRLRIFTPTHEMPFAGHPTVGTACLLAELGLVRRRGDMADTLEFVFGENVGPVPVRVRHEPGRAPYGELTTAVLPEAGPPAPSAETLAARFQSLDGQLRDVASGVNSQIVSTVDSINVYAQQIATLNDAIEKAQGGVDGQVSNDLLDQRDYAVAQLSQQVKASVVKQGNSYNVFIGNGQPLVVGAKPTTLVAVNSTTDPGQMSVGYVSNGKQIPLAENSLTGGSLGGLIQFRNETLNVAQNSLGRIAVTLAMTFNAQHQLGQDQNGAIGGNFFVAASPLVQPASSNDKTSAAGISATITDPSKLTTSDYKLQFVGGNYVVTRMSDNAQLYSDTTFPTGANVIEGVTLSLDSGSFSEGDQFVIRPTANGASGFSVAIKDTAKIAAAAPIRTSAGSSNTGTGRISAGSVNAPPPIDANLQQPVSINFTSATDYDIVDPSNGAVLTSGTYTEGADISFNGWTVQVSGAPATGDSFGIGPNTNGTGDPRNATALAQLQSAKLLGNGSVSYQGAYAQLVATVGNKTSELDATSKAENEYLTQATNAQQAESGVNLDEEATNLLRYQQAYQAAGKVMQTTSELFQLLLSLGGN